jgi:phytoene desaturase
MNVPTVLVIGAGIGGLTAATHLARAGMGVTVVDRHREPGGRCGRLVRDGHRFDTGPTLLVMPLQYETEFRALGSSFHERLDLRRVDPTYSLVFDDGSQLALTSDMESMRSQLEAIEPGSFDGLQRYLQEAGRNYSLVSDRMINREFRRPSDFFTLDTLGMIRTRPFTGHYRNMARFFRAPRLKAAFTFQDLYVGLSPFEAPATFSLLPWSELAHGVWYPLGGMFAVAESLAALAREAGVELALGSAVSRIDVRADRAIGVTLADGSRLRSDVVIANADLPYVHRWLLPNDPEADKLSRRRYSCSAISFFWGLDRTYDELRPHTLFLADDYRENFRTIVEDHGLPANPGVYLHAPRRLDPSVAPPGRDSLTAIVPVGHLTEDGSQDWPALRDQARGHVFRRLRSVGIDDLHEHIVFEASLTPESWWQQHNLMKGATHGLSHQLTQMAWFRPSNRHRRFRNLYFVGASTHPGTGVPMAMISGRLVARRVAAELP